MVQGDMGQLYERTCPWLSCFQEVGHSKSANPAILCQETPHTHLLNKEVKKLTQSLLLHHSTNRAPAQVTLPLPLNLKGMAAIPG